MKYVSAKGIEALKKYEGLRLQPYKDSGGLWTIGYGHLIKNNEPELLRPEGITEEAARRLFVGDLARFALRVNKFVTAPLTPDQFDALVSWDYNTGRIHNSTLTSLINKGAPVDEILSFWLNNYVTAGGVPVAGLRQRREHEARLYAGYEHLPVQAAGSNLPLLLTLAGLYIFFFSRKR